MHSSYSAGCIALWAKLAELADVESRVVGRMIRLRREEMEPARELVC